MESSSSPTPLIELSRLVADRYRRKGYEVYVDPPASILPEFTAGYRPDILALSGNDRILIELKTARTGPTDPRLKGLADVLRRPEAEGWRMEVYYTSPSSGSRVGPIDKQSIQSILAQSHSVAKNGHLEAALLLAWAGLEAAVRHKFLRDEPMGTGAMGPRQIVAQLESLGAIDASTAQSFRYLGDMRNAVAHGAAAHTELSREKIFDLLGAAENILEN